MSILFKNAKIITTEKGSMKVLENAYLGVDGKFIDYIGTQKPKKSYTEEIDMYDKILMPGIVNGHAHSAMNLRYRQRSCPFCNEPSQGPRKRPSFAGMA